MAENEVKVKVTADTSAAKRAIDSFRKSYDSANNAMINGVQKVEMAYDSFFNQLRTSSKQVFGSFIGNLAANAVSSLSNLAYNGFRTVTKEAMEFETAIAEINTLLPKTNKLNKDTINTLKDISGYYGTSQQEQAKAYYQIISAGAASANEGLDLLRSANTLASAGLSDLGSSINVLTDILNVYGEENISAKEASDSLFTTVRLGKTTIGELSTSIGQVLPAAERLNISLDDVGAALATMTTQGLSTSERVTQLNALFTAVFRKSSEAKQFGKEVGDAFNLTALRTKGLRQFLIDLNDAVDGNEETLQKLLGRTEAVKAVFALTGKGAETFGDNLLDMANKAGAANDALAEIEKTSEKQFAVLRQNVTNFLAPVGQAWNEFWGDMAKSVNMAFGNAVEEAATVNEQLAASRMRILEIEKQISLVKNMQGDASGLQAQLQAEKEMLKVLQEQKAARSTGQMVGEETGAGGAAVDTYNVELERRKQFYQSMDALEEERNIAIAEGEIKKLEAANMAGELELQSLRELELRKLEIKKESDIAKAMTIDDATKREREIQTANAKYQLDVAKLNAKQELDVIKEKEKQKRIIFNTANQTLGNFLSAGLSIAKQGSREYKALAIADAIRQTYVAANNALATPAPYPLPMLFAASTIATGLANVANITKSGSHATGGVIGGFTGAQLGADDTVATVKRGEMVLNGNQQKELFTAIDSGSMNSGNDGALMAALSQPIVVEVDGKEIARATRTAREDGFAM